MELPASGRPTDGAPPASRMWLRMQRIERSRYRAEIAQAKARAGSTDAYRAEMAEVADAWLDVAAHIEREDQAPEAATGARPLDSWTRTLRAAPPVGALLLGIAVGVVATLAVSQPLWIEAALGWDIDGGTGTAEGLLAALGSLLVVLASRRWRWRRAGRWNR